MFGSMAAKTVLDRPKVPMIAPVPSPQWPKIVCCDCIEVGSWESNVRDCHCWARSDRLGMGPIGHPVRAACRGGCWLEPSRAPPQDEGDGREPVGNTVRRARAGWKRDAPSASL